MNKEGSVIVIAMIFATLLVTASLSITTVALSNLTGSKGLANAARAFYAAEAGIELALYQLAGHEPGFEVNTTIDFPEGAKTSFKILQRSNILPEEGMGDGIVLKEDGTSEDAPQFNLLERGSLVKIGLSVDKAANYLAASNSEVDVNNVTVEILPSARDSDPGILEPSTTCLPRVGT